MASLTQWTLAVLSHSVVSSSWQPHGLQPTRPPLSMGFSRQEYWSGLPCPPPGDLPNPGIKPKSPALAGRFFTTEPPGKPLLFLSILKTSLDFPDSSVGKEPACNAGDPSSLPRSGSSTGEGIGYPLQYSWASLVAQLAKNLPATWETWVRSLDWEDPLEKG